MQRATPVLRRLLSAVVSSSSPALRPAFLGQTVRRLPELAECPIQRFLAPTCEFSRGYAQGARKPAPKKEPDDSNEDDDDSDDYEGGEFADDVDDEWDDDNEDDDVFDGSDSD